jgi:filamentous hemagglutinin family protein
MALMRIAGFAVALASLGAQPLAAQTVITADTGAGGTGTVAATVGNETAISGGTLLGPNLFHSFGRFDLAQGDIAQWVRGSGDAVSIANVVNRVVGGDPSDIAGTLRVKNMPNAAFWFINPAGVVFGSGASIDVPGAAYFSTAQEVRFADGARFSAVTPEGATFTSAPPEAFGFLGPQGNIAASGLGADFVKDTTPLSLSAAAISLDGTFSPGSLEIAAIGGEQAELHPGAAPRMIGDGRIEIGGDLQNDFIVVGSASLAANEIVQRNTSLGIEHAAGGPGISIAAGKLELNNAVIGSAARGADQGAPVSIRTGLLAASYSTIQTLNLADGDAGALTVAAGRVELFETFLGSSSGGAGRAGAISLTANDILATQSTIYSSAFADGDAADVAITADDLTLVRAIVASQAETGSSGDAAAVTIDNGSLISDGSRITSSTFGAGRAGTIRIAADKIALTNSQVESTTGFAAGGDGGSVVITGADLQIDDSRVSTSTFGMGNAGSLLIDAGAIVMRNLSSLSSDGGFATQGNAGNVTVKADSLSADGSFITSATFGSGHAGTVRLDIADALSLTGAIVAANTFGAGDGGNIFVDAGSISLLDSATIDSGVRLSSTGGGGNIAIRTGSLSVDSKGYISSTTLSARDAGSISVDAGTIYIGPEGEIRSQAEAGSAGKSGNVMLRADSLEIAGGLVQSGTFGQGDAGTVTIRGGQVKLSGRGRVFSQSEAGATGNAGMVDIAADTISADNSRISSATLGSGNAGDLTLSGDEITLMNSTLVESSSSGGGTGDAGAIIVRAGKLTLADSALSSVSDASGDAGDIQVQASSISGSRGVMATATFGSGAGGTLRVDADTIDLSDNSRLSSLSSASGDAGSVRITARSITADGSSFDSVAGAEGNAGDVTVSAETLRLSDGLLTSRTIGSGRGGNVGVDAASIDLADTEVTSSTAGTGDAGNVAITGSKLYADDTLISTSTSDAGNAGTVSLAIGEIELSNDTFVTSQANSNASGRAGAVAIATQSLYADDSAIATGTFGPGSAGTVTLVAGFADDPESGSITLGNGSYISSFTGGSGSAGTAAVTAGRIEVNDRASIDSEALSAATGDAGGVKIDTYWLIVDDGFVSSATAGTGGSGSVEIGATWIDLLNGGEITTDSEFGPAGDITLTFPRDGQLTLAGDEPGLITTTSGMNTGGRIAIATPYLILSDGGSILALGEQSGANVAITADFYIRSADRPNLLSVDGTLLLDSQIGDLSTGTEAPGVDFIDAASVLSGQCAAARSTGRTSRFTSRITGPYALPAPPPEKIDPDSRPTAYVPAIARSCG